MSFSKNSLVIYESLSIISKGLELSSYKIELRNRVTQNDVTLRVTDSKIFIEVLFRVTNSTSYIIKLNFELLTRRFNFYLSTFELLNRS